MPSKLPRCCCCFCKLTTGSSARAGPGQPGSACREYSMGSSFWFTALPSPRLARSSSPPCCRSVAPFPPRTAPRCPPPPAGPPPPPRRRRHCRFPRHSAAHCCRCHQAAHTPDRRLAGGRAGLLLSSCSLGLQARVLRQSRLQNRAPQGARNAGGLVYRREQRKQRAKEQRKAFMRRSEVEYAHPPTCEYASTSRRAKYAAGKAEDAAEKARDGTALQRSAFRRSPGARAAAAPSCPSCRRPVACRSALREARPLCRCPRGPAPQSRGEPAGLLRARGGERGRASQGRGKAPQGLAGRAEPARQTPTPRPPRAGLSRAAHLDRRRRLRLRLRLRLRRLLRLLQS